MTTVLANRGRLEAMLRATVSLHGDDVLDDPTRLRALLSAESADMDAVSRASVDRLLSCLASGVRDLAAMTEPAEVPADRLRARCDLAYGDAIWLVNVVRSIVWPLAAGSASAPPPLSDAELEMLPPPPTRSDEPAGVGRSRRPVIVLAAALVIVLGVGIAMVVSERSSRSKAENELASTRNGLLALQDELAATNAALADVPTPEANDTTGASDGTNVAVEAQAVDAVSIVAAIRAQLDVTNRKLSDAQATASALTTQLNEAKATRDQLAAPFDVLMSDIRPTSDFFTAIGNVTECRNFVGDCQPTNTLSGQLTSTEGGLQFESPGYVIVPLTSTDGGASYTGMAAVADERRVHCNIGEVPEPTNLKLTIVPTHYTVRADLHSVIVTTMNVTWRVTVVGAGGCAGAQNASYEYDGFTAVP